MPEPVGSVYSDYGYYYPDRFSVILREGVDVKPGEFLWIITSEGKVYYQAIGLYIKRQPASYEEVILKKGPRMMDEERNFPRVEAEQVGILRNGRIEPYLGIITPHQEVYRVEEEDLRNLLAPTEDLAIKLGKLYPGEMEIWLRIWDLTRRGLVVFGGIGSGKTTTLLSIIYRLISTIGSIGKPGGIVIDKDYEYGPILEEAFGAIAVNMRSASVMPPLEAGEIYNHLRSALGIHPSSKQALRLKNAIINAVGRSKTPITKELIMDIIRECGFDDESESRFRLLAERYPSVNEEGGTSEYIVELARNNIVVLDLSSVEDWDETYIKIKGILESTYKQALEDRSYGVFILIDEAHLFAPEKGGVSLAEEKPTSSLRKTLKLLSTTGPRNGVVPFIATQRPALIDKTITTQLGQNLICHRVEDIDLERVKEMIGGIAETLKLFPAGRAIVKATAAPLPRPIVVDIVAEKHPSSRGMTALDRWLQAPQGND